MRNQELIERDEHATAMLEELMTEYTLEQLSVYFDCKKQTLTKALNETCGTKTFNSIKMLHRRNTVAHKEIKVEMDIIKARLVRAKFQKRVNVLLDIEATSLLNEYIKTAGGYKTKSFWINQFIIEGIIRRKK